MLKLYNKTPFNYSKALSDWFEFRTRANHPEGSNINIFGINLFTYKTNPILMKSFAKSGLLYFHDVWDYACNKMKSGNEILPKLRDKRNWIAEVHVHTLRTALQQYKDKRAQMQHQILKRSGLKSSTYLKVLTANHATKY